VRLFKETSGRVFVAWSAQNLDRTATLYRACKKAERTLVVDLYGASVLEALQDLWHFPQPARGSHLTVVITKRMKGLFRGAEGKAFVERMAARGMSATGLAAHPERWVVMVRRSLIEDFEAKGIVPSPGDAWSHSQWSGYLENDGGKALLRWFAAGGSRAEHLHTSGHASSADLRAFARAMDPRVLIPVHGLGWDGRPDGFPTIRRVQDGETLAL